MEVDPKCEIHGEVSQLERVRCVMLEIKEVEGKVNGKRGGDEGKPEALERGSGKRDRRGGLRPVKLRARYGG